MARKLTRKLPPMPKAPAGPPPELPSETRKRASAELSAGEGPAPAPVAETPLQRLLRGRDPRYPFVPPALLDQHSDHALQDVNRVHKIGLFYDKPETYRQLVAHFGDQHKLFRDK